LIPKFEIQINDDPPFEVEKDSIIQLGCSYGSEDVTEPQDKLRRERLRTMVAEASFRKDGGEYTYYGRRGQWSGNEECIRFHIWDLLEIERE
jgi:hypothetical protein